MREPNTDPIPAPDPATPTVAAPAPMNLAAESMSFLTPVVVNALVPWKWTNFKFEKCQNSNMSISTVTTKLTVLKEVTCWAQRLVIGLEATKDRLRAIRVSWDIFNAEEPTVDWTEYTDQKWMANSGNNSLQLEGTSSSQKIIESARKYKVVLLYVIWMITLM